MREETHCCYYMGYSTTWVILLHGLFYYMGYSTTWVILLHGLFYYMGYSLSLGLGNCINVSIYTEVQARLPRETRDRQSLAARVLLYAPSHRQDNTYHSLCYNGSAMKDRSDDPSHHERMLLPQSYISLRTISETGDHAYIYI